MLPGRSLFIKLMQFFTEITVILIVYMNELNLEYSPIVELCFHVAKHEDGRRTVHIHIVFEMRILSKLAFSR
jgi:hypothetical protein